MRGKGGKYKDDCGTVVAKNRVSDLKIQAPGLSNRCTTEAPSGRKTRHVSMCRSGCGLSVLPVGYLVSDLSTTGWLI
jgi:hypothetical protein